MNITTYSLMSGQGFGGLGSNWIFSWIMLAFLAIIIMFAKKWLGEEEVLGFSFNWIFSLLGILAYWIVITFTGSYKISFIVGLVGLFLGGYLGAIFFGGGSD